MMVATRMAPSVIDSYWPAMPFWAASAMSTSTSMSATPSEPTSRRPATRSSTRMNQYMMVPRTISSSGDTVRRNRSSQLTSMDGLPGIGQKERPAGGRGGWRWRGLFGPSAVARRVGPRVGQARLVFVDDAVGLDVGPAVVFQRRLDAFPFARALGVRVVLAGGAGQVAAGI